VAFVALGEDEFDGVVSFASKLKNAVSSVSGSVAGAGTSAALEVQPDVPVWDSATQGYRDKWGNYSYDGGKSWGPPRAYTPPPEPNYSLGGPGFNTFNTSLFPAPSPLEGLKRDPFPAAEEYDPFGMWGFPSDAEHMGTDGVPTLPFEPPPQPWSLGAWQSYVDDPRDTYSVAGPAFDDFNVANFNPSPPKGTIWDDTFDAPPGYSMLNPNPNDTGSGFWGGVVDYFADQPPIQLAGGYLKGINAAADDLTGTSFGERAQTNISGNKLVDVASGGNVDLNELPYGLGNVTDTALAPATWLGAGIGPSVPILGSTFSGSVGKRLAGETLVGAAGLYGSEAATSDFAEDIPIFGDQPAWLRGLEGGLLGAVGGVGAGKLAGKGVDAALNAGAVDEAIPSINKASIFGNLGEEAQYPAYAKDITIPPGRAIPQVAGAADEVPYPKPPLSATGWKVSSVDLGADGVTHYEVSPDGRFLYSYNDTRNVSPHRIEDRVTGEARGVTDKADALRQAEEWAQDGRAYVRPEPVGSEATSAQPRKFIPKGPGVQPSASPADTALNEPRRKLLDALDAERKFRTSGEAEEIIHQGRVTQARGIGAAAESLPAEANFSTAARDLAAGARTGTMLPGTSGLQLDDATQAALIKEAIDFNGGKSFDNLRAIRALDKLNQGQRLQPAEIKALRAIYGDEIADVIARTNAGRIQTVADLTPEDLTRINRQAEIDGKRIATLEVEAQRQHELADNLVEQSRMAPTDTRLKKAAEDARARALAKENDADRLLAERAARWATKQEEGAQKVAQREARDANLQAVKAGEARDRADILAEARVGGQEALVKVEELIEAADVAPALKEQAHAIAETFLRNNAILLDGLGPDGPGILRTIYAGVVGEVTDSWTSKLLTQRAYAENALIASGYSEKTARQVGKLLQEMEVARRWGPDIPPHIQKSLAQAKPVSRKGPGNAVQGAAAISQEWKNTAFSIFDVGVFLQQGLKAVTTDNIPLLAGIANRIANMAHLGIDTNVAAGSLPRKITNILDGSGTHARGVVDVTHEGTLLDHIPGIEGVAKKFSKAAGAMSDLQFRHVMGFIRDLVQEGNLVLARVAGADIQNPAVRQNAMDWANAATSAGKLAQRAGRAQVERGGLLTPSMRRAQIQQIGQVVRGLTAGTRTDRVLAAATILSTTSAIYAAQKYINDWIGVDDFEWNPGKPGFGDITFKDGTVWNIFPQEQIAKAIARSIDVLATDGINEDDWAAIGKEWGKVGMGSASPPLQSGMKAAGYGYQPGEGYQFGNYGEGMNRTDRLLGTLPVPPTVSQLKEDGLGPISTPLSLAGGTVYQETDFAALDRKVRADPEFGGKGYRDITDPLLKARAQEKYGKLAPFGPEGEESARLLEEMKAYQAQDDDKLGKGEVTPEQWRKWYSERKDEYFARNDQIYSRLDLQSKDPYLGPYYNVIEQSKAGNGGRPDWDVVNEYVATLPPEVGEYISTRTGLIKIDTAPTRAFEQVYDSIQESGYFDRSQANWNDVAGMLGLNEYDTYYDWRDAQREEMLAAVGKSLQDVGAVAMVDKYIDQQPAAEAMEKIGKTWREQWALNNPEDAYNAWKFGYFTPTDKLKQYLASQFE
jgi:hypothetical protein